MDYRETFKGMTFNQLVEVAVGYAEDAEKTVVENYKLRAEMKKLDDRIAMHKEEIDAGDRRIVDMEKTIDELRTQAEDRENFILGLENDFNKVETDWKARECHLCDKIESKNGLIGTLRSQLDSAKNTIEALKSRNNENNEINTDLELNNRKLRVRIQELEKQLKQAAELGDVCMDKIRDLEIKNGKLNEEVKNYAELIKENDSLHNRNDHLAKVNNQLDDRVREMIELKDDLYTQIRNMEKRNHELAIERDEYKHAYEHAREECDKLTPLKRRVDQLTAYKETLHEIIRKLEAEKAELTTKLTDSDGIRKAVSEENDKLNRRTWELHRENLILEYEIKKLKETKLGVINSFNFDCEGEYLELKLTHDAGNSFMRNVKVIKEGTAIKVSDFVKTEKPVTPKDLWTAGETVAAGFAAGVKAKEPEEPVCKTVPCSTVIGKLENYWINSEGVRIQVRLSEKASEYFKATKPHTIGEEIVIPDLLMKMPDSLQREVDEFAARVHKEVAKTCELPEHIFTDYLQKPCVKDYDRIAKHIKNKYDALRKVGFTDDQAMSFLPMWDDEDYV